jgi:pyruvate formate lyase activating enzyme
MYGIKGVLDFSLLDWPGRMSTVIFLSGCNFRCPFCHNHALVLEPESLVDITLESALEQTRAHPDWITGVVISGGEPTTHPRLLEMMSAIKTRGLGIKLDTNGSRPKVVEEVISSGLVDHIAMDVKAPLDDFLYTRLAGTRVDPAAIRKSIDLIVSSGLDHTFRTTVIPGVLTEEHLLNMAGSLPAGEKLVLQAFDPADALDSDWRSLDAMNEEDLQRLDALLNSTPVPDPLAAPADRLTA